ncbi:hypothetical protein HAX54_037034 [Datura stramonium]|uniref:Uncharacterized protein n=1 Tax=Datura stramonium TaxID=4076 RepID=A0ABS8VL07_DATST|nr:hypothetical protein [Datura stramonium]
MEFTEVGSFRRRWYCSPEGSDVAGLAHGKERVRRGCMQCRRLPESMEVEELDEGERIGGGRRRSTASNSKSNVNANLIGMH